mgnify:CR=1 FL=1
MAILLDGSDDLSNAVEALVLSPLEDIAKVHAHPDHVLVPIQLAKGRTQAGRAELEYVVPAVIVVVPMAEQLSALCVADKGPM